jgi:hypothetical protein
MKTDAERILQDTVRENALKELAKGITNWMLEQGLYRTCLNCEHWIEGPPDNMQQICGKYNMRPPTKIIVCGCDDHSDNIPF